MSPAPGKLSRALATIELVLIVMPVFLFALFAWLFLQVALLRFDHSSSRVLFTLFLLVAPISCACCAVLLAQLIRGRSEPLGAGSAWIWAGLIAGVGITLIGFIARAAASLWADAYRTDFSGFGAFAAGLPMLLPALHVAIEQARARGRAVSSPTPR